MKISGLGVAIASGPAPSARSPGAFAALVGQLVPEPRTAARPLTGPPLVARPPAGPTFSGLGEIPVSVSRDPVSPASSREPADTGSDLRTLDGMPIPVFLFPVTVTAPVPRAGASGSREGDLSSPTSSVPSDPSTPTAAPPASTAPDPIVTEVGDPARFDADLPADASAPIPEPTAWAKSEVSASAPATTDPPPELVVGAALREPPADPPIDASAELRDADPSVPDIPREEPAPAAPRALELPMSGMPERRIVDSADVTAPPPLPEEFLPPASVTDDIRIRIDADLSVHVARHGQTVDVRLNGTPDAVLPLMGIGPELGSSLADGGFDLGHFGSGEEPPPRPETEDVPETARRTPERVRSGRYA